MPGFTLKIKNISTKTPCEGFYVMIGETTDISNAKYARGVKELVNVVDGSITVTAYYGGLQDHIFVFLKHCDDFTPATPTCKKTRRGAYQIDMVKFNCPIDCDFSVSTEIVVGCDFDISTEVVAGCSFDVSASQVNMVL
jgi:hypothetical protein